jgi:hypothetical protein
MLPVLWWDLNQNKAEYKDGAKMVNAVSNSVVPKFTVIVGNSMVLEIMRCGKHTTQG